ncbi:MAG: FHA domain-containing protein [Proteobacteria bacterium]|nr:FHA domain-containing protein [Pseudomonadota bacterium]
MRLSFPNNEHADVLVAAGDTTIGSAADNVVVLATAGIAAHHARLTVSERSIVIGACTAQARIHVNARPVVEKAILRLGDVVSLDTLKFVLKPDRDDSISADVPAGHATPPPAAPADAARVRQLPARVVLRGVSGAYFGKIVPVRGRLTIGRGSDCGLVLDEPEMPAHHAVVENSGDGIYLRAIDSGKGTQVNGVLVRDAVLHTDDQIAFERNRFVLEAPSLPTRRDLAPDAPAGQAVNITQTMRAIEKPAVAPATPADAANRNDIWWLIGAAALIAAGIAVLLYLRF